VLAVQAGHFGGCWTSWDTRCKVWITGILEGCTDSILGHGHPSACCAQVFGRNRVTEVGCPSLYCSCTTFTCTYKLSSGRRPCCAGSILWLTILERASYVAARLLGKQVTRDLDVCRADVCCRLPSWLPVTGRGPAITESVGVSC
jgi:hypothetical protein